MNEFGDRSNRELATCDHRLQAIAEVVLQLKDHSILKGHRGRVEQTSAFRNGFSKVQWPNGKHNALPSVALDAQTYPRPETEQELREEQFYLLGLYVGVANGMGITLRTGADWDSDGEVSDNGFDDLFHAEIKE